MGFSLDTEKSDGMVGCGTNERPARVITSLWLHIRSSIWMWRCGQDGQWTEVIDVTQLTVDSEPVQSQDSTRCQVTASTVVSDVVGCTAGVLHRSSTCGNWPSPLTCRSCLDAARLDTCLSLRVVDLRWTSVNLWRHDGATATHHRLVGRSTLHVAIDRLHRLQVQAPRRRNMVHRRQCLPGWLQGSPRGRYTWR